MFPVMMCTRWMLIVREYKCIGGWTADAGMTTLWIAALGCVVWVLTRKRTDAMVGKSPGVQDTKAGASPEHSDPDEELTSGMRSPEVHDG
jgi:hypothetical protein